MLRASFNPELNKVWFGSVMEVISNITMLVIVLTGAALIREREHGTVEHLLAMPVTPFEIMAAKVWAMVLVGPGGHHAVACTGGAGLAGCSHRGVGAAFFDRCTSAPVRNYVPGYFSRYGGALHTPVWAVIDADPADKYFQGG